MADGWATGTGSLNGAGGTYTALPATCSSLIWLLSCAAYI